MSSILMTYNSQLSPIPLTTDYSKLILIEIQHYGLRDALRPRKLLEILMDWISIQVVVSIFYIRECHDEGVLLYSEEKRAYQLQAYSRVIGSITAQ